MICVHDINRANQLHLKRKKISKKFFKWNKKFGLLYKKEHKNKTDIEETMRTILGILNTGE